MTHNNADFWERWHHAIAALIRGKTYENQYVGTVKTNEEELERALFHETDARYNWLAYWKRHADDGRDSEGSWKLRYPRHSEYIEPGKQLHITLFPARSSPPEREWLDVYAHYEYDNVVHPWKHIREHEFSAAQGVNRCRRYFIDNGISLYELRNNE